MNLFVTAGNTQTPLDEVRCVTNIFTGQTGARIAVEAFDRGHAVTIATSHPNLLDAIPRTEFVVRTYRTFEDLEAIMAKEIGSGRYDAVIHAAAVNDYHVAGVFVLAPGIAFDEKRLALTDGTPAFRDVSAGKVKGNHAEVWVRMVPAPKLVDRIRTDWKFAGTLVKFKLEVGATEAELLAVGERSRAHSRADWLVANTLDGRNDWAYLIGDGREPERIARTDLPRRLLDAMTAPPPR